MGLFERISGLVGSVVQLGIGGPKLKNNSGVIESRNPSDTDYAVLRAGTPLGASDVVPRSYADLVAHIPNLDSPQYVGMFTSHISTLRGPSLGAGAAYTVLDMDGAGYLSKIFCTLAGYTGGAPSIKFQVFVDGEVSPSIDVFVEDMCCFRSGTCSSDRAGGGIGSNGLSFFFNFVAPFSSHIKVLFVDQLNSGAHLLGGYLEYKLGTGMNWGLYGKLWSSTMNYTVVPYATQNLLNITSATGGVFVGGYYDMTGESDFHYLEGWLNAIIDGGAGSTNWINGGGNFQVPTGSYMFDSNEDYGENGFYFSATGGAHNQTRNVGLTFSPSSGHVAWYKWHYENPMVFSSTFTWDFVNGCNGSFPTVSNTTVKGVLWYYTGAVGSVVSPTTIKGDQGVPGTPGAAGAPGTGSLTVVAPTTSRSPIILLTGNNTLADSSGNGYSVTATPGAAAYMPTRPGGNALGLEIDAAVRYYTRNVRTPALDLVGDLTIEFVLNVQVFPPTGGNCWVLTYGATHDGIANTNMLYAVFLYAPGVSAPHIRVYQEHGANVSVFYECTKNIPLCETMHIAVVRSGTTILVYVNGTLQDTFNGTVLPTIGGSPVQTLKIGSYIDGGMGDASCIVEGLQIIGSALTGAEVLADAKAQLLWL